MAKRTSAFTPRRCALSLTHTHTLKHAHTLSNTHTHTHDCLRLNPPAEGPYGEAFISIYSEEVKPLSAFTSRMCPSPKFLLPYPGFVCVFHWGFKVFLFLQDTGMGTLIGSADLDPGAAFASSSSYSRYRS